MTTADEPAWLTAARAKIGVRETPGPGNSPTILGWAKHLGTRILGIAYNADATPWCGLFVAECMDEVGIQPPPIAVRASSWDAFGHAVSPRIGAVLRFERPGGGHVALYVGEDDGDPHAVGEAQKPSYHVLGGNQADAVTIMRLAKDRMVTSRWPNSASCLTRALKLTPQGAPTSTNEA